MIPTNQSHVGVLPKLLKRTFLLLIAAIALGACGEDRDASFFDETLDVEGPTTVNGRFAFLHRTFEEVFFVTPGFGGDGLTYSLDRVDVGADPLTMQVTPDGANLLLINAADQTLSIIDASSLAESRVPLPSDYDALTIGPNGRFVVAHYHDASAGGSGDSVFRNENEITIFDLTGAVPTRVLSLRSTPLGFDFAPSFTIAGSEHHLLVVKADSSLTLVDLTATDEVDLQRRLFFVPEDSTRYLVPQTVIFTEDDPSTDYDMKMFVLTSNAQDIFEVSILPPAIDAEEALALSLNQFPAGSTPVEMLSYWDAEGDHKILVLNGSYRHLVIVDVDTGNTTEVPVLYNVDRAIPYTLINEETAIEESWALLYDQGSSTVLFVHLDGLEDGGSRAIHSLALSRPVDLVELAPVVGSAKAIVVHSGHNALSVLDLERRYDIPLPGSATLRNIAFSPSGEYLFTTVGEVSVMAIIDLSNGHPSQIDIPDPGERLGVLTDPQTILIDHGDSDGRMTLLSAVEPSAETSTTVEGLFLETVFGQAFDRGVEAEEE